MTQVKCKNCRWWVVRCATDTNSSGDCHYRAPQVNAEEYCTVWPITTPDDWCGDGQVKVEED